MDEIGEKLARLQAQRQELAGKIGEIDREILATHRLRCERDYGVKVGCIVVLRDGTEALVADMGQLLWGGKPWLQVQKRRKNGEWSVRDVCVYREWEVAPCRAE